MLKPYRIKLGLPNMELKFLLEYATTFAKATFDRTGEIAPMWHARPKVGQDMIILTPWNNRSEKEAYIRELRELFKKQEVQYYMFMSEAWSAVLPVVPGSKVTIPSSLKNHPDRREIVLVRVEDKSTMLTRELFILRPEHGPPTLSDPKDIPSEPYVKVGLMDRMLDY